MRGPAAATYARRALRDRSRLAAANYRERATQRGAPPIAIHAVAGTIERYGEHDPCANDAVFRIEHEVASEGFELELGGAGTIAQRLTELLGDGRAEAAANDVAESLFAITGETLRSRYAEQTTDAPLEVTLRVRFDPAERFATPDGGRWPGVSMIVETEIRGPTDPTAAHRPIPAARYRLPASFALEVFREGTSDANALSAVYARMLEQLYPNVRRRLGQVVGTVAYATTASARSSYCADAQPIVDGVPLEVDTEPLQDITRGECTEDPYAYDSYDDVDFEEDLERAPELVSRLVVTERSRVGIFADCDFAPAIYIRSDCLSVSTERVCEDAELLSASLDEGVYFVTVDGSYGGDFGECALIASVNTPAQISAACRAARPLSLGETVRGVTDGARDVLHSPSCGGIGGYERLYTIDVAERSRLRCSVGETAGVVMHLRSNCRRASEEVACSAGTSTRTGDLAAVVEAGRYTLAVDSGSSDEVSYALRCDVVTADGADDVAGDRCDVALPLDLSSQHVELVADTFRARNDHDVGVYSRGPDLVYRFEAREPSWFSFTPLRTHQFAPTGWLSSACDANARGVRIVGGVQLAPGTHFLTVDSSAPNKFGRTAFRASLRPSRLSCERVPSLRLGQRSELRTTAAGSTAGSCGGATGLESVGTFRIAVRSRVRFEPSGTGRRPFYVRRTCADPATEVFCARETTTAVTRVLEPGEYTAFIEMASASASAPDTLLIEATPVRP